ncbi:MAG TPA: hypothetical protein VFA66_01275 [Gaiellaceae bacterium]|nr:hypothetical protein [Gaiellaceae bacterium]
MSSEANIVKELIDRGMAPIEADMARFRAGLDAMGPASDKPSASAITALRSARDHASAALNSLKTANQGHIRLVPGGGQAIRGFLYLSQGLSALLSALSSTGATTTGELASARKLLARSGSEFLAADRAMHCPYGCHKPPTVTIG